MSFPNNPTDKTLNRVRAARPRPARDWVQTPIFVYGTLRRGQPNYLALLRGWTVSEIPASIDHMDLHALRHFPVMVEGESTVYGEWMILHPVAYTRLMAELDRLEGYNPAADNMQDGLYRRVKRLVRLQPGGEAWAWVYVGNPLMLAQIAHTSIPHGDWVRYQRERGRAAALARVFNAGQN